MRGERWADIPMLDGAYLISNYGRIKALARWIAHPNNSGFYTKERILKLRLTTYSFENRTAYRLAGQIGFDRKRFSIPIARMVYNLFVEPFDIEDRCLSIAFKDEDSLNIGPYNLRLTTRSAVITKAYKLNRRERTSFGWDAQGISQYDLQGKFLRYFQSISLAVKETGINGTSIARALQKKDSYACEYLWKKGKHSKDLPRIPAAIKKMLDSRKILFETPITRYNLQGKRIAVYADVKAAKQALGVQTFAITSALKGQYYTVRNSILIPGKGSAKLDVEPYLQQRQAKQQKSIWRPVLQLDKNGKKIKEYPSVASAARAMQVNAMSIHTALKGDKVKYSKGFRWKYKLAR